MTAPKFSAPDVLIVGAGPVGLVAAIDLARRGVDIRIVDALENPTTEPRAVVLHARSLEMMDALGIVDRFIESGQYTRGLEFHADGVVGQFDLTGVDSRYPFTISTPQTETERILRERLAEFGVTVEYGMTLTGLAQDASGVHATITTLAGSTEAIDAAWLVGSDGAHGSLRHLIGERLEGKFKGEHFLMADVEADYSVDHERMHMFFPRNSDPEMMFPMVGRRVRLIAQIEESEAKREATIQWMQQVSDDRGLEVKIERAHWLTTFEVRHAQVENYRVGRVFLAGDAAHVHSPAGGQGMNTGMQDAFNLGWKLALVVAGAASESLLDSYQAERHPIAEHVLKVTTAMTKIGTSRSPIMRRIRDFAFHHVVRLRLPQRVISREVEEIGVAYRRSDLVAGRSSGPLRAGDAAPDVADSSLWDQLHRDDPRHVVLVFGTAQATVPDGVRLVRVSDPDGRIARRYGIGSRGGVVVVRPDGYVGLIAARNSSTELDAYFRRILGTRDSAHAAVGE